MMRDLNKKLGNNLGPDVSFGLRERWLNFNMEAIVWGNLDGRLRDSLGNSLGIDLMCSLFESIDRQLRSCAFDEKLKATLEKSYE